MNLKWKRGNGEDTTGKTVSHIDKPIRMSIHKCFRCKDSLFFTCNEFGIRGVSLCTENIDEAEEIAMKILFDKCEELAKYIDELRLE